MHRRNRGPRRVGALVAALCIALAIASCGGGGGSGGSSGESAQTLLKQTFSGSHSVKSGVLGFSLIINTNGSATLTSPISLNLSGPFQSRGPGKLPASHLTISFSALGQHGSFGIITTGTAAYITLDGANYQLPQAEVAKLESSFASGSSSTAAKASLSKLGIHPLDWLENPTVVGSDTVGGTPTTHIHATVNVTALLTQLATLLTKASAASSATASLTSKLSPAELQKISSAIKSATVDVWTAQSDKSLRKLTVNLTIAVTGKTSTSLGGVSSAGISFTLQYADLNQPQTITAPASVQPYSQFTAKLQGLLGGSLLGGVAGGSTGSLLGSGSSSSSGAGGSGGSSTAPGAAAVQKYTTCIQKAAGDVSKMQKCAALLQGG